MSAQLKIFKEHTNSQENKKISGTIINALPYMIEDAFQKYDDWIIRIFIEDRIVQQNIPVVPGLRVFGFYIKEGETKSLKDIKYEIINVLKYINIIFKKKGVKNANELI